MLLLNKQSNKQSNKQNSKPSVSNSYFLKEGHQLVVLFYFTTKVQNFVLNRDVNNRIV